MASSSASARDCPASAWEELGPSRDMCGAGSESEGDDGEYDSWTRDMADAEFLHDLVDLKAAGKASAQAVCVIASWATRTGANGPVQSLAMAPGKDSGKYSQKFDSVVYADHRDKLMYSLTIPSTNRAIGTHARRM